jgi:subtilisin family serine protease
MLTMLAPGVAITASGLTMSGTSQAAPHVAGAVAVLAGAFPNDALAIRTTRLLMTKTIVTDSRNKLKKPRLDLQYAIGIGEGEPAPLGAMTINEGETYTTETTVTVDVTARIGNPDTMCVSTSSSCKTWIPYAPTATVTLPVGDGAKTIYVKWKSASGKTSAAVSSKIILDTLPPSLGSISGTSSKGIISWRWTGIKDKGVGIESYFLRGDFVAPPADCDSGTLLYSGTLSTFKTGVLPKGTTQFVRLCALDKAGYQSIGATAKVVVK